MTIINIVTVTLYLYLEGTMICRWRDFCSYILRLKECFGTFCAGRTKWACWRRSGAEVCLGKRAQVLIYNTVDVAENH